MRFKRMSTLVINGDISRRDQNQAVNKFSSSGKNSLLAAASSGHSGNCSFHLYGLISIIEGQVVEYNFNTSMTFGGDVLQRYLVKSA